MDDPIAVVPLRVRGTLGDALKLYRLLFLRSVMVATIVYAVIALLEIGQHDLSGGQASLLELVISLLTLAGPALVQGALVELVRNIHEGRRPDDIPVLLKKTRGRVLPLVGASLVYAFGVALGFICLVVPGLIAFARWSLMPPLVVLEGRSVGDARLRSRRLVHGNGVAVFISLFAGFLATDWLFLVLVFGHFSFATRTFGVFIWSSLTAPFVAHILTVMYYRLSDTRPVIHPDVLQWRSVWDGPS